MKKWNRRTRVVVLSVILALIFIAIYAAGVMLPEELTAPSIRSTRLPPSLDHFFGTDALGRDLFFRTLKGLSVSMTVGLIASVISAVIAVFVGIAAATGSRRMDSFINWVIDLMMGVPHMVLIMLISVAFGRGLKGLLIGVAATHWCSLARNPLVQPGPTDPGRGYAASKPTVCSRIPATGQVQRLDPCKSSAAASGAPVLCGTGTDVPSCHFARSCYFLPGIWPASGPACHRHHSGRKHELLICWAVVACGLPGTDATDNRPAGG